MRPDGSPANRDPVFLQETNLVPNAGRLLARKAGGEQGLTKSPSFGFVRPPTSETASGLTSSSLDPALPITMYTEAAVKMTYNGTFYVGSRLKQLLLMMLSLLPYSQHASLQFSCG